MISLEPSSCKHGHKRMDAMQKYKQRHTPLTRSIRRQQLESLEPRLVLDSTVVFNEIMYHPSDSDDGNEWLELHNQMSVDIDLSGWTIDGGVEFAFPPNARIAGGDYLVIARRSDAVPVPDNVGLFGPFEGRLSNGGEQLRLLNRNDRVMDTIEYSDSDPWPAAADGTGASLAKSDSQAGSDTGSNWTHSPRIGGTPGTANFVDFDPTPEMQPLVPAASTWSYSDGTNVSDDWAAVDFDDRDWQSGEPIFYRGEFQSIPSPNDESGLDGIQPISIKNPSFESNTNFGVGYGRIDDWQITGATGINPSASNSTAFFDNGTIADGRRVAFLQGGESSISQQLSGLVPSQFYELEIHYNARSCCNITPNLSVSLGNATLVDIDDVQPTDENAFHTEIVRFIAADESAELNIANNGGDGDHTLLVDSVSIHPVTEDHLTVANPSFEASGTIGNPGYLNDLALAGWGVSAQDQDRIGISADDGSLHDNGRIPSGSHALFMQGVAQIEQTVEALTVGDRYEIAFRYNASAAASPAEVVVSLDGFNVVSTTALAAGDENEYHKLTHRFVAADDSVTFAISQSQPNATLFVDDVTVRRVDSPLVTEIATEATTHYFRHKFEFQGNPDRTDLQFEALLDDAAAIYLNGDEIWRTNLPDGPLDANTFARTEAQEPLQIQATIPRSGFILGTNVIAVELHQASDQDRDLAFSLEATEIAHPVNPNADLPGLAINEVSKINAVQTSIELFNFGETPIDLSNYQIQTGNQFQSLTGIIDANEAKTLNIASGGSNDSLVAIIDQEQQAIVDAIHAREVSLARSPDGTGNWFRVASITPSEMNRVVVHDSIVINEIMYHHQPNYTDYATSPEEWIELYNRSDSVVDLSDWSLTDAITFAFPAGTTLEPDDYLIVGKDTTALSDKFPNVQIVGDYVGQLNNGGDNIQLRDALGNLADEVHYYDSGRWPTAADGGGASLELIDPHADNSIAESWAASSEESAWKEYSYRVTAATPSRLNVPAARFHEIIFGLLDSGEVLLDDVRVVETPDDTPVDRMQNGNFETDSVGTDPASWRIIGNHQGEVIIDPDDPTNQVLKLTATGPTEHMHNHAEVTFANRARIDSGEEYEISFKAKWLSGSPLFNSRLYFVRGAKTTVLDTIIVNGTPGAANGTRLQNLGPTYAHMQHGPIVPNSDENVTVSIEATDPDGVSNMTLHYAVDRGEFVTIPMKVQPSGYFSAEIPAQRNNDVVSFYVTGTDSLGAVSYYPADGPASRALYRVEDRDIPSDNVHSFRLILTPDDVSTLHTGSNVMSNGRIGATVIYNDQEIFYDVGVRLRASGYGRQGSLAGFNVQFHPDHLFRDVHSSISLDHGVVVSSGTGGGGVRGVPGASPHELLIYQIAHHAGGIAGMYDDVVYVDAPRSANSGLSLLKMARYTDTFLDSQFENGSEGSLYKFELFYHANTTIDGRPESLKRAPNGVVGTDISNLGDDEEAYRLQFILKNNRDKDDFDPMIRLGKTFSLSSRDIGPAAEEVIDVDQWMRTFALTSLVGTADTYNMGLAHNLYLYERPSDGKVLAMPWDVDHGFFYSPTARILGAGTSNLRKIVNLPQNRRLFYKHLLDMTQSTYNPEYLGPWIDHYSTITNQDQSAFFLNYVTERYDYVTAQLDRVAPQIPFEISTNAGDVVVTSNTATIEGTGWIDVDSVTINGLPTEIDWLNQERWSIRVFVREGINDFELKAFDFQGREVGADSIQIMGSEATPALFEFLRVSELMYNPSGPTTGEANLNPSWNNNDFEYIELVNTSDIITLDLTDVRITDGPSEPFSFDDNFQLGPGERTVVVANKSAFTARYGNGEIRIAGEYAGNLSNGGEALRVESPRGIQILAFDYSDEAPWPQKADGDGFSLELISPTTTPVQELSDAARWNASAALGGTPGRAAALADFDGDGNLTANDIDLLCKAQVDDATYDLNGDGSKTFDDLRVLVENIFGTSFGDANLDGKFDSSDLVAVFQAAQYEDDISQNSTWATGDWNCDGEFGTTDLVVAFQHGRFVRA